MRLRSSRVPMSAALAASLALAGLGVGPVAVAGLPDADWVNGGIATFYGGAQDGMDPYSPSFGTKEGSCGYGLLQKSQYPFWSVGAVSTSSEFYLHDPLKGCGECFEIQCLQTGGQYAGRCNSDPTQRSVTIMITDSCPQCGSNHFDIQALTYAKMAIPQYGRIDVRYRRVECQPPTDMKVIVDHNYGPGAWLRLLIYEAAGAGTVSLVQVKGPTSGWMGLTNTWGAAWELSNAPQLPYDFRIVSGDGQEVTAFNVITASGQVGMLPTGVNFAVGSVAGPAGATAAAGPATAGGASAAAQGSAASAASTAQGSAAGAVSTAQGTAAGAVSTAQSAAAGAVTTAQQAVTGAAQAVGASNDQPLVSAFQGPPQQNYPPSRSTSPSPSPSPTPGSSYSPPPPPWQWPPGPLASKQSPPPPWQQPPPWGNNGSPPPPWQQPPPGVPPPPWQQPPSGGPPPPWQQPPPGGPPPPWQQPPPGGPPPPWQQPPPGGPPPPWQQPPPGGPPPPWQQPPPGGPPPPWQQPPPGGPLPPWQQPPPGGMTSPLPPAWQALPPPPGVSAFSSSFNGGRKSPPPHYYRSGSPPPPPPPPPYPAAG